MDKPGSLRSMMDANPEMSPMEVRSLWEHQLADWMRFVKDGEEPIVEMEEDSGI